MLNEAEALSVEELRQATAKMDANGLLRHLVRESFPGRTVVTSSLRARSIVVLHMISEIDRSLPVIFCHAPYVYPESVDYRALIVRRLGLTDVRDPVRDESDVVANDKDHHEDIQQDVWGGGRIETEVHLNRSLANFDCWISAGYHMPYTTTPTERLTKDGRMLRVNPLSGWNQEKVHKYLADRDLPLHPLVSPPSYAY